MQRSLRPAGPVWMAPRIRQRRQALPLLLVLTRHRDPWQMSVLSPQHAEAAGTLILGKGVIARIRNRMYWCSSRHTKVVIGESCEHMRSEGLGQVPLREEM